VGVTVAAGDTAILEVTLWGDGAWGNGTDWGGVGMVISGMIDLWAVARPLGPGFLVQRALSFRTTALPVL
jgi:hypothetical protein